MTPGRRAVLSGRFSLLVAGIGVLFLIVLLAIAQRTTSALWFMTFPLLLAGVLLAAAAAVLRMLRHF
jgi:hypothetical protein